MELSELRREIDRVDAGLTALFQERMDLAADVAGYKRRSGLPVLDEKREAEKLEALAAACRPELAGYAVELFREVFRVSREYQEKLMEGENG